MTGAQIKTIVIARGWSALAAATIWENWRNDAALDHLPPPPPSLPSDLDALCTLMSENWQG